MLYGEIAEEVRKKSEACRMVSEGLDNACRIGYNKGEQFFRFSVGIKTPKERKKYESI